MPTLDIHQEFSVLGLLVTVQYFKIYLQFKLTANAIATLKAIATIVQLAEVGTYFRRITQTVINIFNNY